MKLLDESSPLLSVTFEPHTRIEQPAGYGELAGRLKAMAPTLGVAAVGFTSVAPFEQARERLQRWISDNYHGQMHYLATGIDRADPRQLHPPASTLIMVAVPYPQPSVQVHHLPVWGHIAGYAQGGDYHVTLRLSLFKLGQLIASYIGRRVTARICVDTAPLLEREAASRAGLGFVGKSNMLIVRGLGSRVLLGALLVDVPIAPDEPQTQRCGRCSACIESCPTQAFVGPWLLDSRRCISYLTIEFKGWIPLELRSQMGSHVFGCDICQDVCPYNHGKRSAVRRPVEPLAPKATLGADLTYWLRLTSSEYRRITKRSALRRASRAQLLRNAAVAAGNANEPGLALPLRDLLVQSKYPVVRGHAAWALGRIGTQQAIEFLTAAQPNETDALVHQEIEWGISGVASPNQVEYSEAQKHDPSTATNPRRRDETRNDIAPKNSEK